MRWFAAALTLLMKSLTTVAYAGMALLAWAHIDRTCATVFISRFNLGAGTAMAFSGAAMAVYGLRRWTFRMIPLRGHLLLMAAAPLV
ncbi:MAG: hypothetical protein ACRDL7_15535, partial [Gaiellaceae bacterium]